MSWRSARVAKGLSQVQAAARLRISQPYLAMLETGSRRMTRRLARRAMKVYDLPATVLPPSELGPSLRTRSGPDGLAQDLAERARMSWVGVWLMDITAGAFHLQRASGFASENEVPHHLWTTSFGAVSPLIKRFEFDKTLLLSDETAQDEERDAAHELARWSIAAALPMYSGLRSNWPLSSAGADTLRAPIPIAVRSTV